MEILIAGDYEDVWYDPNLFDEDLEEDADEWEENMLQEYGWYMHSILAEDIDGIHANYHTHGLRDNFNHQDLQIALNMDPEAAHSVLYHNRRNKEREKFEQGIEYTNIIEGYPIIMKSFVEMDREVLRVLLPDERGILPTRPECDECYKTQLDDIEES